MSLPAMEEICLEGDRSIIYPLPSLLSRHRHPCRRHHRHHRHHHHHQKQQQVFDFRKVSLSWKTNLKSSHPSFHFTQEKIMMDPKKYARHKNDTYRYAIPICFHWNPRQESTKWAPTSYKWSYNLYKWPKINGFLYFFSPQELELYNSYPPLKLAICAPKKWMVGRLVGGFLKCWVSQTTMGFSY